MANLRASVNTPMSSTVLIWTMLSPAAATRMMAGLNSSAISTVMRDRVLRQ
jgi:hypothetical protein